MINIFFYVAALIFCLIVAFSTGNLAGFVFVMAVFFYFGNSLLKD